MSKFQCSKVSFSFFFLIQPFALLFVHRDFEEFRSALFWLQLDKFPRFLFCHTPRGVWNSLLRLKRKRTTEHMKIFPSMSFLITLLVKVSEKVLRSRVLRLLVTTMFPQLSVRNTTFNKPSQLILYSARDKTF